MTENLEMQRRVRNRHEPMNKWLKNWEILKQVYRHDILEHGNVFRAIVVIAQLSIENGELPFEIDYNDK